MDFSQALIAIKQGDRVARQGWNGKGIFIFLVVPSKGRSIDGRDVQIDNYIAIDITGLSTKNDQAPRTIVPWLASQTDLLAEDWEIFDPVLHFVGVV